MRFFALAMLLWACFIAYGCFGSSSNTQTREQTTYTFSGTVDGHPVKIKGKAQTQGETQSQTEMDAPIPEVSGIMDTVNSIVPPPWNLALTALGGLLWRQRTKTALTGHLAETATGVNDFLSNPEVSDTVKDKLKKHLSSAMSSKTKRVIRAVKP